VAQDAWGSNLHCRPELTRKAAGGSSGRLAARLVFDPTDGPGYVLFETNGRVGKGIPTGGEEAVFVEGLGGEAYWLTGLRLVQYQNLDGDVIYESRRVTDQNTLIWSRGGLVFRIEGPLEMEAAVEIAQSLE
jgi:hypothetical protein